MATIEEVDALIESGEITWTHTYTWNGGGSYEKSVGSWEEAKYELDSDGIDTRLGRLARVDEYGGEGQGDDYWVVVSLTQPDGTVQYFRRTGWYASHDGGYLENDTEEVTPFEKTVTDFRSL